jgi:hypothetical protein
VRLILDDQDFDSVMHKRAGAANSART